MMSLNPVAKGGHLNSAGQVTVQLYELKQEKEENRLVAVCDKD